VNTGLATNYTNDTNKIQLNTNCYCFRQWNNTNTVNH